MKKLLELKLSIGLIATGGLVALFLLAVELKSFVFRQPEPFSFNPNANGILAGSDQGLQEITLGKPLMFIGLLLFIFIVLQLLFNKDARKKLMISLLQAIIAFILLWLLTNNIYQRNQQPNAESGTAANQPAQVGTQAQTPEYVTPKINPWLIFGVSFGIVLGLTLTAWWIYSRRPGQPGSNARDEIAEIARDALNGLQPGANWDEAIVRAYLRMNEVVTEQRGFIRPPGSTPSEFALRMEREGLPGEAVRTLTRLFEGVRYGGRNSSGQERDLAAAALSAILHFCGVRN